MPIDPASEAEPLRAKVRVIQELLCAEYRCPIPYFHDLDPLSELVSSLLSHRTRNADSGSAFRQLRARFPSWATVRDAPVAEVQATIASCTWPEQKAPRLQQILRLITQERGSLSLDFLETMASEEAQTWLQTLPGVGPKTSAAVLAFSRMRRVALPMDSHHHRARPGSVKEHKKCVVLDSRVQRIYTGSSLPDKGSNLGPTDPETVALPTELSGNVKIFYQTISQKSRPASLIICNDANLSSLTGWILYARSRCLVDLGPGVA